MNKLTVRQLWAVWLASALVVGCSTGIRQPVPVATGPVAPAPTIPQIASGVDPTTLDGKLMFGYQGWFGCPGDGSLLNSWEHWSRGGEPTAATLRVDMWPDVSELSEGERCKTSMALPDGRPAQLY